MQPQPLDTPIEYLKGVGPQRAEVLKKEAGIFTFNDLLYYFPFRYIDRTQFHSINQVTEDMPHVQLKGCIIHVEELGVGRNKRLRATFEDSTGQIELVWFKGVKWIKPTLKVGSEFILFGKATSFKGRLNIAHPELELIKGDDSKTAPRLQAVYPSGEKLTAKGLTSKGFYKLVQNLLSHIKGQVPETISQKVRDELRLISKEAAMFAIHAPQDPGQAEKARFRLKFEELYFLQLQLLKQKLIVQQKIKGHRFDKVSTHFNSFFNKNLPFELTGAQKRVVKEIRKDLSTGAQMNRLLQGDVGSGKTLVALLSMLIALDNGFQATLMAPTEILAQQHYRTIAEFLHGLPITVSLLTGSTPKSERTPMLEALAYGRMHIIVGTHALLEEGVKFHNLGIAVIDEQHRFGVQQRAKLWHKNNPPPHILVMTATPIPRTLAMTFYGDLDTSVIDELPPGRKDIKTYHYYDNSRLKLFGFIEEQIKAGRQIYIVYPLIEESEKLDYADLMAGYESISRRFPLPNYRVSVVHGRMKSQDKDYEMQLFKEGKTHIMVATTVIEVGVDVPNATVMVIESAEKFGLSQLHQLRGRVGRGGEQSYCILMTSHKLTNDGKKRLETMVRTNDGFEIAEVDLKLRGPGDIMGTMQSGMLDMKLADLARDSDIVKYARKIATETLTTDPDLELPENKPTKRELVRVMQSRPNWSRVS